MAFNSFSANAFMNNFAAGFSFVDDIKRNKRDEARLETRLEEERRDRAALRQRNARRDQVREEERTFNLSERKRLIDLRNKESQVFDLLNDPDVTVDQLAPFSDVPAAREKIQQLHQRQRVDESLRIASGIPVGQVTAPQGEQGLSDQVTQQTQPGTPGTSEAANNADPTGEFTFGAPRGLSSLQRVSEEEFNRSSRAFQEKNFFQKVGDVAVGQGAQTLRAVADAAKSLFTGGEALISTVADVDRVTNTQNVADEFTGTISVPADKWTDETEFEAMQASGASQEEILAAQRANEAITLHYETEGAKPSNFTIPLTGAGGSVPGAASRQGAALSASDDVRRAAEDIERKVVRRYTDFNEAQTDSHMNQLAVQNPKAASALYLSDRATYMAADPTGALKSDRLMVPVMNAAEEDLAAEMSRVDPATAEYQLLKRSMTNLQNSRNIVAGQQPKIATQAGINSQGLKQGDSERVDAVLETVFDSGRPMATQHQPDTVKAAAQVASRVKPGARLNEAQIQAISVLAEALWIDKPTAMTVMMTGAWPPGKNPKAITDILERGDYTFAKHQDGTISQMTLPRKFPKREIAEDQTKWILEGAESWGMDDNQRNEAIGLLSDYSGWLRKNYNTNSQESMRAAGRAMGQAVWLSNKERIRMSEDGWWNLTDPDDAPRGEDVFLNPKMRNELSKEHGVRPVPMPAVANRGDLDFEPFRESIAEGAFGADLAAQADTLTQDQLEYIYWVQNATPEDIEAANRVAGE
jgi:hypothetical protein